jgi:hypothetical protein
MNGANDMSVDACSIGDGVFSPRTDRQTKHI